MAVSGSTSARMTELQLTNLWHRETGSDRTEPAAGKSKADRRVPVVYYLSRNGQLDHPHFMEVPLSSPNGLFLPDVIGRLNALRGNGISAMYSWSCKRSYKNGFVWHDLSENDFVYPAHGHEYVLKGSELLLQSPENRTIAAADYDNLRRSERRRRNQSCSSIDYDANQHSVYKAELSCRFSADSSTQTDDGRRRRRKTPEIVEEKREEIAISPPPPSDSSPETLETLLKADARSILHTDTTSDCSRRQIGTAAAKSSVFMQLISCGSMDCGAGQVISQYRMRMPRRHGAGGGKVKLEEKEYFSGSIVEKKKEEIQRLKRCSSCNADR